ncbi:hypothetical protein DAEQUDRAFT_32600 [Daedalea quercina L-15889]|uniref:Protein kinase domain-containing protein n=1 Tax=Daedalea quercina L-15889 TaxID=1314783 RepID=A0A165SR38_9APHY|nr:hypothetical protein DAEQUDRAFT_32600 [Daedalea quercina L-15889]
MSTDPPSHKSGSSASPYTSRSPRLPYYVYVPDDLARIFEESTRSGAYSLTEAEKWWSARELFLSSAGYSLRQRYRSNWQPSWLGTNKNPEFCEDSIMLDHYKILDAVRESDDTIVSLKMTKNDTNEVAIAQYLSSSAVPKVPQNHCVPILDVLLDPFEPDTALMVMPYLRPFDDPPFGAIGEVLDFIGQTLEGLAFLHRHRVAHRDCAGANIMMDGRPLYPQGHHPVSRDLSPDAVYELVPRSRSDYPVRYYFIDFGISSYFPFGTPPLVLGLEGRDKEVPELSKQTPYDAFKVDIFILGNLYKKYFVQKYSDFKMLESLIDGMTRQIPKERLTAEEAMTFFEGIRASIDPSQLRARVRPRGESTSERMLNSAVHMAREGVHRVKKLVT